MGRKVLWREVCGIPQKNVVFRLAQETSLVLLNGGGFDGPEWSVRASLANLNESDYVTIGQGIKRILDEYAEEWRKNRS
jgi:aspartate 4-decarboxylase